MNTCVIHPTIAATGACEACKRPICTRCTKGTLDGFMCPPCAHQRYARQRWRVGLKVAGVAALMVVLLGVALITIGKGTERSKPKPAPVDHEPDPLIAALRDSRAAQPCELDLARKLAIELGRAQRYAELVDDATSYFAKCGSDSRLERNVVDALQQLNRFGEAVKHETVLIEDAPFQSDYWWWRGEDRGHDRQPGGALADYRQSLALSRSANRGRGAARRIPDAAEVAGQPCDAMFALEHLRDQLGGELTDDEARRVRDLTESPACVALRGTGHVVIAREAAATDRLRVLATVNGVTGNFLLDGGCGTTALSSGFAQRAQVVGRAEAPIQTVAVEALLTGAPGAATVALVGPDGNATATAVEVAIVEGLPADLDGVLGLSFLWRFVQTSDPDGFRIGSPPLSP